MTIITTITIRASKEDSDILCNLTKTFPDQNRSDIIRDAIKHYDDSVTTEKVVGEPPLDDFGESRFNGKYLKKLESCLMTLDEQQLSMFKGQVQTILGNAERAARLRESQESRDKLLDNVSKRGYEKNNDGGETNT